MVTTWLLNHLGDFSSSWGFRQRLGCTVQGLCKALALVQLLSDLIQTLHGREMGKPAPARPLRGANDITCLRPWPQSFGAGVMVPQSPVFSPASLAPTPVGCTATKLALTGGGDLEPTEETVLQGHSGLFHVSRWGRLH